MQPMPPRSPVTAVRMLEEFQEVRPGASVVQNGANSAVGRAVIQVARARGAPPAPRSARAPPTASAEHAALRCPTARPRPLPCPVAIAAR